VFKGKHEVLPAPLKRFAAWSFSNRAEIPRNKNFLHAHCKAGTLFRFEKFEMMERHKEKNRNETLLSRKLCRF
jgi:hypothetical protein